MARNKRSAESVLKNRLRIIRRAGIKPFNKVKKDPYFEYDLNKRIQALLNITKPENLKPQNMLYLIMYDIENDKVRNEIAKYLIKKGCIRIQKSVYVANTERIKYKEISKTLKEVNETYENHDSILIIPIASDEVRKMNIIGEDLDVELILGNRNTMIF
jgi:CRISPR-associated endonuclease Cas2